MSASSGAQVAGAPPPARRRGRRALTWLDVIERILDDWSAVAKVIVILGVLAAVVCAILGIVLWALVRAGDGSVLLRFVAAPTAAVGVALLASLLAGVRAARARGRRR